LKEKFARHDWCHEADGFSSWHTGRKLLELVLIAKREHAEQPTKYPAVRVVRRNEGAIDDALPKAIREKLPMFSDPHIE